MNTTDAFAAERPQLVMLAARVLRDPSEAEDVVQQAWLRLHGSSVPIVNLPAWLTTVTVRPCLDRLTARTPVPTDDATLDAALDPDAGRGEPMTVPTDPAEHVALADTVAARCTSSSTG